MEDKISVTVIATGFDNAVKAEDFVAPEIETAKSSDTMSLGEALKFEPIGTARKMPVYSEQPLRSASASQNHKVSEKAAGSFENFGFGTIYEDAPFGKSSQNVSKTPSSPAPASSAHAQSSASRPAHHYSQPQRPQPEAENAPDFSDDISKPACWRNLSNLSSKISFGDD